MDKVLQSESFVEQINELKDVELKVTQNRGKPVLEQTKRNLIRRQLLDSLFSLIENTLDGVANVYRVSEGVAIELDNPIVYEASKDAIEDVGSGSGAITITLDATIHDLSYDAFEQAEAYSDDLATKEAAKLARAEKAQKAREAKATKEV